MKNSITLLIFIAILIVQGGILNLINILGVTPNLLLSLVIIRIFLYNDRLTFALGIIFSIILDICFSKYIGVFPLSLLITILVVQFFRDNVDIENKWTMLTVAVIGNIVFSVVTFVAEYLLGFKINLFFWVKMQTVSLIYNSMIMFIIYLLLIKKVINYRNDRYLIWKKY